MSCTRDFFLNSVLALLSDFTSVTGSIEIFETLLFAELDGAELFAASVGSIKLSTDVGPDSIVYPGTWADSSLSR
jgi:hypothetical protein